MNLYDYPGKSALEACRAWLYHSLDTSDGVQFPAEAITDVLEYVDALEGFLQEAKTDEFLVRADECLLCCQEIQKLLSGTGADHSNPVAETINQIVEFLQSRSHDYVKHTKEEP